ncbi:AbrB family transcriptional regulator [Geminicoccaceae bacterium SYSU G07066]|uniref:AbrB family transcriptional regulator n=1 Tax=Benzoatithermus flavus TaxID=3108223 RepID=A0ABU8XUK0_9PROT
MKWWRLFSGSRTSAAVGTGRLRTLTSWAVLLVLSLALAFTLQRAGLPAAFLLGALLVAMALALKGIDLRLPRFSFLGAQALIGCMIAEAVTGSILATVAQAWAVMLLTVATTILAGGIVGWGLTRLEVLPGTTAAWGSSPGAASAMVAMAEEYGADPRLVAFMQYLRVVVVVLSASLVSRLLLGQAAPAMVPAGEPWLPPLLPFVATLGIAAIGAVAGRCLWIPAGPLLLPMAIGAVLHVAGIVAITLPPWLLGIAYLALGWYVGLRFDLEVTRYAVRAIPRLLLATLALIGLCALSAWLLTRFLPIDGLTAFLATSPGGLDSVAIIAVGSNADVPFVLAIQTLRLFLVVLVGPPLARFIARTAPRRHGPC